MSNDQNVNAASQDDNSAQKMLADMVAAGFNPTNIRALSEADKVAVVATICNILKRADIDVAGTTIQGETTKPFQLDSDAAPTMVTDQAWHKSNWVRLVAYGLGGLLVGAGMYVAAKKVMSQPEPADSIDDPVQPPAGPSAARVTVH